MLRSRRSSACAVALPMVSWSVTSSSPTASSSASPPASTVSPPAPTASPLAPQPKPSVTHSNANGRLTRSASGPRPNGARCLEHGTEALGVGVKALARILLSRSEAPCPHWHPPPPPPPHPPRLQTARCRHSRHSLPAALVSWRRHPAAKQRIFEAQSIQRKPGLLSCIHLHFDRSPRGPGTQARVAPPAWPCHAPHASARANMVVRSSPSPSAAARAACLRSSDTRPCTAACATVGTSVQVDYCLHVPDQTRCSATCVPWPKS